MKWTVGILIILSILGTFFWTIFYSVNFANFNFVIPLRNWYQDTYFKVIAVLVPSQKAFKPANLIWPIQVLDSTNGMYTYRFLGTYSRINSSNQTLYLQGSDNRIYSFIIPRNQIQNEDPNISGLYTSSTNSIFDITWTDKRTLSQILSIFSKDPTIPINTDQSHISHIQN